MTRREHHGDTPATAPRVQMQFDRLRAWSHRSPARSLASKVLVTVLGPVVVVVGAAMTVLPGPGLVVIAAGFALLAVEYDWAATTLRSMGRWAVTAKNAALPADASVGRRVLGLGAGGVFFAATFALTTAVTTYLGATAIL